MSQQELDEIRASMGECERLEALLEAAKARRTQLATRLHALNGPTRTYMLAEIPGVCDAVELLVSRTKPRRDGTVSYFFAEKQRWQGGKRQQPSDTAAPIALTGRVIEATAALTGRSETGRNQAGEGEQPLCSVCSEPQFTTPSGDTCPNGHGGAPSLDERPMPTPEQLEAAIQIEAGVRALGEELFRSLPAEELVSVPVPSQAEIESAIEQGRQDAEAFRASRGGVRLPIVGDPTQPTRPEPRLLQIAQPRGLRPVTHNPETGVWRVPLTQGQTALVDEEDVEFVGRWNWQAHCTTKTRGTESPKYYARRYVGREGEHQVHELMHREIGARFLPLTDEMEIDHKSGNGLDNRRANLRIATKGQNMQNAGTHSDNTSGFKGVHLKDGRWIAQFNHEGLKHHVGSFDTPEEAHAAYADAIQKAHGEFANTGVQDEMKSGPPLVSLSVSSEPEVDPDQAILDELLADM